MGMGFYLTCIPLAEIADERLGVLREIVARLAKEDCSWESWEEEDSGDRWETFEEWVQAVKKVVELLPVVEDKHWREVNHLPVFAGQPYDVLFTGGLSWGDALDLYDDFQTIRSATPVVAKLVEWAKVDKQARPPTLYTPDCQSLPGWEADDATP
jgi:hypothetical protein